MATNNECFFCGNTESKCFFCSGKQIFKSTTLDFKKPEPKEGFGNKVTGIAGEVFINDTGKSDDDARRDRYCKMGL